MKFDEPSDKKPSTISDPFLDTALQALGKALNIFSVYGESHPAAREAIDASYSSFEKLFVERPSVCLGAFHGMLTIDGKTVSVTGALKKGLERRLVNLKITGLKIGRGITPDEFKKLVDMLNQGGEEAFKKALAESGMEHVGSEETTYKAVREGEEVVGKGGGGGKLSGLDDEIAAYFEAQQQQAAGSGVQVEQIVAFLKGDVGGSQAVQDQMADAINDPNKLAELILESTAVRQSVSSLQGETLADVVLGCLRKTYDSLKLQPDYQGKDGKESLKKAMLLLERSILDRMRNFFGQSDPAQDRRIIKAIQSMNEDMELEMLAASYMEQRHAVRQSTEKIVQYIQAQGVQQARERLGGVDLSPEEWRQMVVQSKRTSGRSEGEGGPEWSLSANLGTLGMVLEKLEGLMRADQPTGDAVKELVDQAHTNVSNLAESTEKKIQSLSDLIKGDNQEEKTVGGTAVQMNAGDLLATLAEIAQELAQPLTAINTSLEMILNGYAGEVTDGQKNLLQLATGSGEHMHYLMDQLLGIVGYPTNLGVDERFAGKFTDFVDLSSIDTES
ncbi:hypothetical protein ACFLQY_05120 [Verrucomicrobiota bacterium]